MKSEQFLDSRLLPWIGRALLIAVLSVLASPLLIHSRPEFDIAVREFGYDDGLPRTLFGILQSKEGYLYIATHIGLVRYNGYEFVLVDGNGSVFSPVEDAQGNIWMSTHPSGSIYHFKNEKTSLFSGDASLQRDTIFRKKSNYPFVVLNDTVWTSDGQHLYKLWNDTAVNLTPLLTRTAEGGSHYLQKFGRRCLMIVSEQASWQGPDTILSMDENVVAARFAAPVPFLQWGQVLRDSSILALTESGGVVIQPNGSVQRFSLPGDLKTRSFYEEPNGTVWILTTDGAFRFDGGKFDSLPQQHLFPRKEINGMIRDHEGNYWFTSRRSLLFVPYAGIFQLFLRDWLLIFFEQFNSEIWMTLDHGDIFKLDSSGTTQLVFNSTMIDRLHTSPSEDILVDRDENFWLGRQLHYSSPPYRGFTIVNDVTVMRRMTQLRNGNIILAKSRGFTIMDSKRNTFLQSEAFGYNRLTWSFWEEEDGSILLGSDSGLYRFTGKAVELIGWKDYWIKDVTRSSKGYLLLGTAEQGLVIAAGNRMVVVDSERGLPDNRTGAICFEEEYDRIWLTTTAGLSSITILDTATLDFSIANYSTASGLPSNAIAGVEKLGDYLWLGTRKGVCRFRPDELPTLQVPPPINITGLRINNTLVDSLGPYRFPYDQNNLSISFCGIAFRVQKGITYGYRIVGQSNKWVTTSDRSVHLFSMPPGDYVFQVTAMNEHGYWNPQPAEVRFTITPHFADTLWFKTIALMALLLLLIYTVRRVLINQRNRYRMDAHVRELRQKMLSINMNPHFVFNVLNSIQSYINNNHLYKANEYLAQFSRLIRMNMEASLSSIAPLDEELKRLQFYLELEQLRLGTQLEYQITVDPVINQEETMVPTMLIQPYVENAVWHGIARKELPGHIDVVVEELDSERICITITDNGPGIVSETNPNQRDYRSISMRLNRERLELLAKSTKRPCSVEVLNRRTLGDDLDGTVVRIVLPHTIDLPEA
ncbi:MAG: histidine kinase [Candidatus Kapaibacterium sp.]